MSFAFVDLPELLLVVDLDSDSILKNVLELGLRIWLLLLREVSRVTPGHLDGC